MPELVFFRGPIGEHTSPMTVTLRTMALEDLDGVLHLAADSAGAPHWALHDYRQMLLHDPGAHLLRYAMVAFASPGLAGFAAVSWLRGEASAELEGIVVAPEYRRQGVGGALVTACMAWSRTHGATRIRLEVRASNGAALALYRRYGFSSVGLRRAYYEGPVEDALLLEAPLLSSTPL